MNPQIPTAGGRGRGGGGEGEGLVSLHSAYSTPYA